MERLINSVEGSIVMRNYLCRSLMVILVIIISIFSSYASAQQKEVEPRDADFYNNRGIAYGEKGQYDAAILRISPGLWRSTLGMPRPTTTGDLPTLERASMIRPSPISTRLWRSTRGMPGAEAEVYCNQGVAYYYKSPI